MPSVIRFSVYEHTLIIKDNRLISRKFIVLKDNRKNIIAWTDFHKYIRSSKNKLSRNISDDGNNRFYNVCKLLNYAFFDKHKIKHLNDISIIIVKDFLNDYGMGTLPGDKKGRSKSTVNICIKNIIDFIELLIEENPGKCNIKHNELFKEIKSYNLKKKEVGA
jgi:hypothetical protein